MAIPRTSLAVPRASQQIPGSGVGAWGTAARQRPTPRLGSGTIEAGEHAGEPASGDSCLPRLSTAYCIHTTWKD